MSPAAKAARARGAGSPLADAMTGSANICETGASKTGPSSVRRHIFVLALTTLILRSELTWVVSQSLVDEQ